jgi:hypothetical protein
MTNVSFRRRVTLPDTNRTVISVRKLFHTWRFISLLEKPIIIRYGCLPNIGAEFLASRALEGRES